MCQLPFISMCVSNTKSPENVMNIHFPRDLTLSDSSARNWSIEVHSGKFGKNSFEAGYELAGKSFVECPRGAKYCVAFRHQAVSADSSSVSSRSVFSSTPAGLELPLGIAIGTIRRIWKPAAESRIQRR